MPYSPVPTRSTADVNDFADINQLQENIAETVAVSLNRPTISNGTDADHDLDITAGSVADSTNVYVLTGGAMTKEMDTAWAAGTAAGGLFDGALANNTTYGVYIIRKDDGSIDYGCDTYANGVSNKPAGYTYYKRIAYFITDGAANILGFYQIGNKFFYNTPIQDIAAANPGINAVSATVSCPPLTLGNIICAASSGDVNTRTYAHFSSLFGTDNAPGSGLWDVSVMEEYNVGANLDHNSANMEIYIDASSQMRYRIDYSGATVTVYLTSLGWEDTEV